MKYKVQMDNGAERVDCYLEAVLLVGMWHGNNREIAKFPTREAAKSAVAGCDYMTRNAYHIVPEDTPEQREVSHE